MLLGFIMLNVFVTVASVMIDSSGTNGFLSTVYPVYISVLWICCVIILLFFEKGKIVDKITV